MDPEGLPVRLALTSARLSELLDAFGAGAEEITVVAHQQEEQEAAGPQAPVELRTFVNHAKQARRGQGERALCLGALNP